MTFGKFFYMIINLTCTRLDHTFFNRMASFKLCVNVVLTDIFIKYFPSAVVLRIIISKEKMESYKNFLVFLIRGNSVNVASRMDSCGVMGRIQVRVSTFFCISLLHFVLFYKIIFIALNRKEIISVSFSCVLLWKFIYFAHCWNVCTLFSSYLTSTIK